jgi:hypothetical protein
MKPDEHKQSDASVIFEIRIKKDIAKRTYPRPGGWPGKDIKSVGGTGEARRACPWDKVISKKRKGDGSIYWLP